MGSIQNCEIPKVYVLDPYHHDAMVLLTDNSEIETILFSDQRKHDWSTDATAILIRSETILDQDVLNNVSPSLRYIIKQGAGVDNIDLNAARARGIQVYNTPGLNSEAVAELTIGLALCVARRVAETDRLIRSGTSVVRSQCLGQSLFRKRIGIVGMGKIGLEVAKKWTAAMEGSVMAYDPYAKDGAWNTALPNSRFTRCIALDELLRDADVISIHIPLTGSTRNLISTNKFKLMKPTAILLNCARGGIVDEEALLHALQSGQLFGAGLDAASHEPPTLTTYGNTLLSHSRVVMTPHIGASTEENQISSGKAAVRILFDLLVGESKNLPPCLNL